LMEQEAGKISSKGRYPKNSINYHAVIVYTILR